MNGYPGREYNILVTAYPPDAKYWKDYQKSSNNMLIYDKTKDAPQGSYGSHVPSLLSGSPFATKVTHHDVDVKKFSDRDYMEAVNHGDTETAQKLVDEAAKAAGYKPVTRYHQTSARFTEFNTNNPVAGLNDSETPNGIFFKDNDHDIGLGGDIQMAVYLKADNLLNFKNREEARMWYIENVPGYAAVQTEYESAVSEFNEKNDALEEQWFDANIAEDEDLLEKIEEQEDALIEAFKPVEDKYRAQLRELLNDYFLTGESGYDGIELDYDGHRWVNGKREDVHTYIMFNPEQIKSADPVTYDDNGNVIPLSERFNPENKDIRYSDRDPHSVSNRSLLANALEAVAQTPAEKEKLAEYQKRLKTAEDAQERLDKLNALIKEKSFAKGPRDTAKIEELRKNAQGLAKTINAIDKKLLDLEATGPLKDLLEREKKSAYKRAEQKGKEAQKQYWEDHKENAAKRDARRKIRKDVKTLDKLLNQGNKEKNVKDGMSSMVAKSLKLADALFVDEYSNRDIDFRWKIAGSQATFDAQSWEDCYITTG